METAYIKSCLGKYQRRVTGKAGECFLMFTEGKDVETICKDLDIKKNTAYVFRSRVQDKLHREIRRLDADLS